VTLGRRHEAHDAVVVLLAILCHEGRLPSSSVGEFGKRFLRKIRTVFGGPEEGLAVQICTTYLWPAEGRQSPEAIRFGHYRAPLHRLPLSASKKIPAGSTAADEQVA
jgi:hypothetical protein